jgi:hypothetical protein
MTAHQLSSATFSSEYKIPPKVVVHEVHTLPSRAAKKHRNRDKVQRSLTIANESGASRGSSFDSGKSQIDFDRKSLGGESSEFAKDASMKRREKKTRASYLKRSMMRK